MEKKELSDFKPIFKVTGELDVAHFGKNATAWKAQVGNHYFFVVKHF
ncbi:MAG: hypothetical protein AB2693_29500 [Candidatus Thiodiazotropha sp.]